MTIRDNPDVLYHWEMNALLEWQDWNEVSRGCPLGSLSNLGEWRWHPTKTVQVNKLHWDSKEDWGLDDIVYRDEVVFDVSGEGGVDELVGYLFDASLEGFSIRYIDTDPEVGIYLQRTNTKDSNIDEKVLDAIVDALA